MEHRIKRNLRCTKIQIKLLERYMANNKTIAYTNSTEGGTVEAHRRAKEWIALRALLRKHGPDKSVEKWKQTWKDLKRKYRREKLEPKGKNVESHTKETDEKNCITTINNSDTIHDTAIEYDDPLESIDEIGAVGAFVKEERSISPAEPPSNDIYVDIPCSSPMQIILTNTEAYTSMSSSTQTSSKPPIGSTHYSNPCISRKPPSLCAHKSTPSFNCAHNSNPPSNCAHNSNPPSNCAHNSNPPICVRDYSSTPATCSYAQCCHQKLPLDAFPETNNLQSQQNALLQRLCNLLEEQNSNLRIRNRIERNKMRFQFCRRS